MGKPVAGTPLNTPSHSRRSALRLGAAGGVSALAGCGLIPQVSEPVNLYTLTPKTTFGGELPKANWQLVVELPVAAAGLDTARIALQRSPFTLEYFADSAWTDNAPAMIQTLLIESFESTNSIVAVGREVIGLRPDYVIKTDLREFQAVYFDNAAVPTIWVRMNAKIVEMPERKIVASVSAERKEGAASGKLVDIIAAFDEALGKVLREIVTFTLKAPETAGAG